MYIGAYQLGDRIPLMMLSRAASRSPQRPDEAPIATIYPESGSPVMATGLPPVDMPAYEGFFGHTIHLDNRFSAGRYGVRYSWTVGGESRIQVDTFDILENGSGDGVVIAMYHFHRPHAEFLVQELDSRKLVKGRNPKVIQ